MKTNYRQRNRRRNPFLKRAAILIVVFAAAAVFFKFSSGFISAVISPIWLGEKTASKNLANSFSWFQSRDELAAENMRLKEELSSRDAEMVSLRVAAERMNELLSTLGRSETGSSVLAAILVRPPETPYDILIVDAGENQGIKKGDKASMLEGPVLGVVAEVYPDTSKVILYSESGEKTNAILERNSIPVVLLGQGGGSFNIDLPRDVEVKEGDKILSAGIPSNLIGVVGEVKLSPTDSFKKVLVKGASNIFSLNYVLITP